MADELRHYFPYIIKHSKESNLIYLDNASSSHKPRNVIDALTKFYEEEYSNIYRSSSKTSLALESKIHKAKENISKFINAPSSNNIIFTSGTTEGINMVANCYVQYQLKEGDTMVITELEHNSNLLPWVNLSRLNKLNLVVIPVDQKGNIKLDELYKELEKKPAFLAITHRSNITGETLPIVDICERARRNGTVTLIDAAQSIAHSKVDVQAIDPDFLVFSGHKMYGPTGIGVLYANDRVIGDMRPYKLGGGMIETLDENYNYSLLENSDLFEAGTMHLAGIMGFSAAVDFINENFDQIVEIEQEISEYLAEELSNIERVRLVGDTQRPSNIFSFNIDGVHHYDLGRLLDVKNITIRTGMNCTHTLHHSIKLIDGSARASIGCYNTLSEAEAFIKALKNIIIKY